MAWRKYWLYAALLLSLSACRLDDQPTLRVGGNVWPGYEPMRVAQQLGYYDPEHIKLVAFPSAVEIVRAYRNGAIDVAEFTAAEALDIASKEPDRHSIILVTDYSNGADAIVAQPPFTSMRELLGKRVGVELNALGAFMLARALSKNKMVAGDIEVVPVALDQHEDIFGARQVDAIVTFEPSRTHLLAKGAHEVFSSREIPLEVADVIMARKELLRSRRAQVTEFVAGWFRALEFMNREPAIAAARGAARYRVTPREFTAMFERLQLIDQNENRRLLVGGMRERLATLSDIMLGNGLLTVAPKLDSLLDSSFIASNGQ